MAGENQGDRVRELPREVRSLVHHVELNRSGWWNRAMDRLVLATVWRSAPTTLDEVASQLVPALDGRLSRERIEASVARAESAGEIVSTSDGRLKVAEELAVSLTTEFDLVVASEAAAQDRLVALAAGAGIDADPGELWQDFESLFMIPLVQEGGARMYEVLTTNSDLARTIPTYGQLVQPMCDKYGLHIRQVLVDFLDPADPDVRAYVLRVLNADFFAEAAGLGQDVIDRLGAGQGRPDRVQVFVDTNFLFSFLQLHDNPSNDIASDLIALVDKVRSSLSIDLYVLPITVDETRSVLRDVMARLGGVVASRTMAGAAHLVTSSGLVGRYLDAASTYTKGYLTPADFFGPYESNLVPILRDRGVELFNDPLDDLRLDQEVIDDVHHQAEAQERTRQRGAKPYSANLHDMVLWHFAKRRRPASAEAPLEVGTWVCTVDYGLIAFDRHKRRGSRQPPVCLTPASLVQLLQFWAPRSEQLERALVGAIREPLLFLDFDRSTERAAVQILRTLSRFENVGDLSETTLYHVLTNDALSVRLSSAEAPTDDQVVDYVEVAIVDEARRLEEELAALKEDRERGQAYTAAVEAHEKELEQVREAAAANESRARALKDELARVSDDRDGHAKEAERLRASAEKLEERVATLERQTEQRAARRTDLWWAWSFSLLVGGALVAVAILTVGRIEDWTGRASWVAWTFLSIFGISTWLLACDLIFRGRQTLRDGRVHVLLASARRGLVGMLVALVVGVVATAAWEARDDAGDQQDGGGAPWGLGHTE